MRTAGTNLVRLVIILWVVFEHFLLLRVLEILDQFVDPELLPPFLIVNEPVIAAYY